MSKVVPYELPQVVAQIPPPPMDVPIPIQKALLVDGESKVVNHLIHGEYKLTNTSWSKLQKKYNCSKLIFSGTELESSLQLNYSSVPEKINLLQLLQQNEKPA